jgi:uncharacterized membrane protein YdjX (TVP38/TMEM64 family)
MSQFKRALLLQLFGLAATVAFVAALVHFLPVTQYLHRAQEHLGAMQFWGAVLYPLLYAAVNVLLLPGGILAIGSGFFYGLWWGFFLNLAGNVTGAAAAFLISRRLGREWVEKRFLRHRRWGLLDAAITRHGWKIIFLSQVHPLFPTSLLNYLYGITRIRFGTCLLWIAIGQAPGLFLYAYLGTLTQLGLRLLRGETHPHPLEYVIWLGGLALTIVTTTALARVALRVLAEVESVANEKSPPEGEVRALEPAASSSGDRDSGLLPKG